MQDHDFNTDGVKDVDQENSVNQEDNHEMKLAWQFISSTNVSVFLTGKAGTGKTTFLRRIRKMTPKRMVVLAPTGVAAINAGGQTIHSFFQLPFGPYIPGMTRKENKSFFKMSDRKKALIRTLDLLVIDEISMVRADMLDQIDDALRRYRDPLKPFGGVQLLLIGDLMQLAPVLKDEEAAILRPYYSSPYFFASNALKRLQYVTIELKHIYRQQEQKFVELLGKVRNGLITEDVMAGLNARYIPNFIPQEAGWIRLTTHNHTAQAYNDARLAALAMPEKVFEAEIKGNFPEISYPADAELRLKEGAQVMFLKNDPSSEHLYYNGKIGTVLEFTKDKEIIVECDNGAERIAVTPVVWENTKYDLDPQSKEIKEVVDGTFTQYPLRTAWAITVHKSQGLTFDHAVLDINYSFTHGQAYVALSRCRTLDGMVLTSPMSAQAIITDNTVNAYIEQELSQEVNNEQMLPQLQHEYMLSLLDELYSFRVLGEAWAGLTRVIDQYLYRQHMALAQKLRDVEAPLNKDVTGVANRFKPVYTAMMQESAAGEFPQALQERIAKSAPYFRDKLIELFKPILSMTAININNKSIAPIYNNALAIFKQALMAKVNTFEALIEKPFNTSDYLNIKAKAMLGSEETSMTKKKPRKDRPVEEKEKKPKKAIGATLQETLTLYERGLSPAEIAKARSLAESTIYGHLAALVEQGKVQIDAVVRPERQKKIREVIETFTEAYTLNMVKEKLPEDYSFGEIRIVQSKIEGEKSQEG